jgi:hypothetical protein
MHTEEVKEKEGFVNIKIDSEDHASTLTKWWSRQKVIGQLDSARKDKLRKLGVSISQLRTSNKFSHERQVRGARNIKRRGMQSHFDKLKEYQRIKGDCNVPRDWKDDRSLGTWVFNQRRFYRQTKTKGGDSDMHPDRIVNKLEQLGYV